MSVSSPLRLVLFDCDGTLLNSAGSIVHCMAATFEEFGLPKPDTAATRSIIGLSLDLAIARLIGSDIDARVIDMVKAYKAHFTALRQKQDFHEPLYPGIRSLLDTLNGYDTILTGIVTGKSRRGVDFVCSDHKLESFCVSRTADECPSKPDPTMVLECCHDTGIEPSATLVVGDSSYDMEMAVAAGALAVAVAWGYQPVQTLIAAGAQYCLDRPQDLLPLISSQNSDQNSGLFHA